jgi:hypothetical protein
MDSSLGVFTDYRNNTKTGKKKIPRQKSVYLFSLYHVCSGCSSLFKIIAEDDQKCEEDISSGCWRSGPFGPGQSYMALSEQEV